MREEDQDSERAIVLAFLRNGYPGLAFATVLVKSAIKTSRSVAMLASCIALGVGGGGAALLGVLQGLVH
jgi:hypothetical protein